MSRRTGISAWFTAVVVALAALAGSMAAAPPAAPTTVRAVLEARGRQFFYAGDPFSLKISISNEGTESVPNPIQSRLLTGFEVRRGDRTLLEPKGAPPDAEPVRPDRLSPNAGYFAVVELTRMYPELLEPGQYSIGWRANGISSEAIVVRMIPKYDPAKSYEARVALDEGSFTIDFFAENAPVAVKAFIDMANAGFYDGLTLHKLIPEQIVEGGDPAGDGSGAPPFRYPAELSALPVVAGTVLMKPASPSPPSNGSQFVIVLRPEPSWTGQATVLGQVVDGLDLLRRISKLPSTQQASKPYYKPIRELRIRSVVVTERAVEKVGAEGG